MSNITFHRRHMTATTRIGTMLHGAEYRPPHRGGLVKGCGSVIQIDHTRTSSTSPSRLCAYTRRKGICAPRSSRTAGMISSVRSRRQ